MPVKGFRLRPNLTLMTIAYIAKNLWCVTPIYGKVNTLVTPYFLETTAFLPSTRTPLLFDLIRLIGIHYSFIVENPFTLTHIFTQTKQKVHASGLTSKPYLQS